MRVDRLLELAVAQRNDNQVGQVALRARARQPLVVELADHPLAGGVNGGHRGTVARRAHWGHAPDAAHDRLLAEVRDYDGGREQVRLTGRRAREPAGPGAEVVPADDEIDRRRPRARDRLEPRGARGDALAVGPPLNPVVQQRDDPARARPP